MSLLLLLLFIMKIIHEVHNIKTWLTLQEVQIKSITWAT